MQVLVLYALLTTGIYYLLARAMITKPLWSRYPAWLDYYTSCAACSGLLYGVIVALSIGRHFDLPFLGLSARSWFTPAIVGMGSMVWTPLVAYVHVYALLSLGVPDPRADAAPEQPPGA